MKRFIKDEQGEAFVLRCRALYDKVNPGVMSKGWQVFANYGPQKQKRVVGEWGAWEAAVKRGGMYER